MKITFLCTDSSLERGSERLTAALANALAKAYPVNIISLYQQNDELAFEIEPIVSSNVLCKGKRLQTPAKFLQKIKELWLVSKAIKKCEGHVFIGVGYYCSILLGLFAWLNSRNKYLAWELSIYSATQGKWKKLRAIFYKKLDGIICVNETEGALYRQHFAQVDIIPNFLPFKPKVKASLVAKRFISVGGLEEEKGFDLLIEAFEKANLLDWELLIIGNGSKRKELESLIEKYQIQNRVTIAPFTKNIASAYANAGCYVLPSRNESFGMVLIEAMECGLPCIAFDCPSGPQYIISDQVNGLLVPANDTQKLARAMKAIAHKEVAVEEMIREAKKKVLTYQMESVLPLWLDLFKRLQK